MNRCILALICALLILFPGCTTYNIRFVNAKPAPTHKVTIKTDATENDSVNVVWDKDSRHEQTTPNQKPAKPLDDDKHKRNCPFVVNSNDHRCTCFPHSEGCHLDHRKGQPCVTPGIEKRTAAEDNSSAEPAGIKVSVNGKECAVTKLDLEITPVTKPVESKMLEVSDKVGEPLTQDEAEQVQVILGADGESEQTEEEISLWEVIIFILATYCLLFSLIYGPYLVTRWLIRRRRNNTPPAGLPAMMGCAVAHEGEDPTEGESEPDEPGNDGPQSLLVPEDPTPNRIDQPLVHSVTCDRSEVLQEQVGSADGLTLGRIDEGVSGLLRSVQLLYDRLDTIGESQDRRANNAAYVHRETLRQIKALDAKIYDLGKRTVSVESKMTSVICMTAFSHSQMQVLSEQLLLQEANRRLRRPSS